MGIASKPVCISKIFEQRLLLTSLHLFLFYSDFLVFQSLIPLPPPSFFSINIMENVFAIKTNYMQLQSYKCIHFNFIIQRRKIYCKKGRHTQGKKDILSQRSNESFINTVIKIRRLFRTAVAMAFGPERRL